MSNPKFVRVFSPKKQEGLLKSELFTKRLREDISGGRNNSWVFPAIRKKEIHFYYKGGRLFKYNGKFQTNIKYGFVPNFDGTDITEDEMLLKIPMRFDQGYDQIKDRCNAYADLEALGVSALYKYSAWNSNVTEQDVVLLDIEAQFSEINDDDSGEANTEEKKIGYHHNRFDIVLYDGESCELRVFEAKHFANKELWAKGYPEVISQIEGYEKIIKERRDQIIQAYTNQIAIMNEIFGKSFKPPKELCNTVGLLIFGFDRSQQVKIKEQYKEFPDVKIYSIGDVSGIKASTLFNSIK